MRVRLNGRELSERMEELATREQQIFEVIKQAAVFVVGTIFIICLPGVVYAVTGIPLDLGSDRIVSAFKSLF